MVHSDPPRPAALQLHPDSLAAPPLISLAPVEPASPGEPADPLAPPVPVIALPPVPGNALPPLPLMAPPPPPVPAASTTEPASLGTPPASDPLSTALVA